MQRIRKRVDEEGQAGVAHGNTGRAPTRLAQRVCERVVALRKGVYRGFNDQHFPEKLVDVEELSISLATSATDGGPRSTGVVAIGGRRQVR